MAAGGLVAKGQPGDNAAPLTITEISQLLKRTVEDRFGFVRLRGELSGVKRAASGHLYCCLKDEGAVIDGVMWRGSVQRLSFLPEDGIEVVAGGKLTTYPGRSKYQIVIETMEIAGEGALLALLDKTRRRLEAEGLFDASRKRPLPFLPGVIGVVTSPTGAVIRDILHRLGDRFPSRVLVWPVLVQGQGAAEQVAAALRGFAAIGHAGPVPRPDLLIVARGGGSIEDLWAFNEEAVVRAVAESRIPTISAVGHETDTTLCDYAADRRAPTPTAAAEMAVPVRDDLVYTVGTLGLRLDRALSKDMAAMSERVQAVACRLPSPRELFVLRQQRFDELAERLPRALAANAARQRVRYERAAAPLRPGLFAQRLRIGDNALARVAYQLYCARAELGRHERNCLEQASRLLETLSPFATLQRGYAVVRTRDDRIVTSTAAAQAAVDLTVRFADGEVPVVVTDAPPRPKPVTRAPKASADPARQGVLL